MANEKSEKTEQLQQKIAYLNGQLEQARSVLKQWTDASGELSRSAAKERAKIQGMGRGIGAAFLGSKSRSTMRRAAASTNASIAKQVAQKRVKIAEGKLQAQDVVRQIKAELLVAKEEYKQLRQNEKNIRQTMITARKKSSDSIDLLAKLKQALDDGLLSAEEYEEKRKKVVSDI